MAATRSRRKYTREVLEPLVAQNVSVAGVIRALGLDWSGGYHSLISRYIREYGLDTSHFLGQRVSAGGQNKKPWQDVLVVGRLRGREEVFRLRRAMIESGIPYVCSECGNPGEWRGAPLSLEVDHRNGSECDNRPENLRFLCPNCHRQTPTWGRRRRADLAPQDQV